MTETVEAVTILVLFLQA